MVWQRGLHVLAAAVIAGAVFLAYYAVWDRYGIGPRVLASPEYLLTADGLELWYASGAGQDTLGWPDWIHRDVRAEIFSQARAARELNVMDDELVQRVRDACEVNPWVAKVRRVRKYHPARVRVDLDYRRPVCMVEVPGGVYPVDIEGTLLPTDFSPPEAAAYPRLTGISSNPMGPQGRQWGDARVVGARRLPPHWPTFGRRCDCSGSPLPCSPMPLPASRAPTNSIPTGACGLMGARQARPGPTSRRPAKKSPA